jgi:hypothetical protein
MDNTVFRLTFDDFEMMLGRKLTEDEKDTIYNDFEIPDWSDYVKDFLEFRGIE